MIFGNQGALWGNAMTWFDHSTGSVWSQPLGEAIVGPLSGERLELMAVQVTSWSTWKEDYPDSLALDVPASQGGFEVPTMSVVVEFGTQVGVYPIAVLEELGPANDVVADVPIAVLVDPAVEDRWRVFLAEVNGQSLTFDIVGGTLIDRETQTEWDLATGRATSGPLEGQILDQLPSFTAFERDARTFWPEANYWDGGG